jgi:hypothetical protein
MCKENILREKLKEFISYDKGKAIREKLHRFAKKNYVPKHSPSEYLKFMNANECDFTINHPQSVNHPWYFCLFTVVSQHVYGDCVEECLDNAMT